MNVFTGLILGITIFGLILYLASWFVHAFQMMKRPQWIGFSEFKDMFNEEEWVATTEFKNSLYGKMDFFNDYNKIHADIVMINGKEFRFNLLEYGLFKLFMIGKYKELEKHDWHTMCLLRWKIK